MGGLLPLPKESHKFVQIVFMGGDQTEAQQRCANVHNGWLVVFYGIYRLL